MKKVAVASLENKKLSDAEDNEMKARLRKAESKLLNIHRKCKGDASETGLVQFAESIMSLNETRAAGPTHKYKNDAGKETEVIIPFNSEFKFNLFVRDLGAEKGGLTVFMKGAPERILTRCDQILLDG
jgi:sodium/potassium-transporting ATPase subunit alpha